MEERRLTSSLYVSSREAVGSYAENQRITAVRRVYQRGCVNPMINIEQLWRDYGKYEEVSTWRMIQGSLVSSNRGKTVE